jgi:hypothetical protein
MHVRLHVPMYVDKRTINERLRHDATVALRQNASE